METIDAFEQGEQVEGIVQCNHCDYWGKMPGYIEAQNKKYIAFVCPICKTIEKIKNPEYIN